MPGTRFLLSLQQCVMLVLGSGHLMHVHTYGAQVCSLSQQIHALHVYYSQISQLVIYVQHVSVIAMASVHAQKESIGNHLL